MVARKYALDAGAACADGFIAEVDAVLDDIGPALLVQGERHPTDAARLRYLGRRALAIAAALEGVPNDESPLTDIEPFARIFPPRMPVEAGIPDGLVCDGDLTPLDRLCWIALWRLVPHLSGRRPVFRGRISWLARMLGVSQMALRNSLRRLGAAGWATVTERASKPSGYGEIEVELHLQRRVDAPKGGVIEASAETRDASPGIVKSDE